ncbi:MAG: hypothetical protein ACK8QZ_12305, partial [Anaerolineales bacterium]
MWKFESSTKQQAKDHSTTATKMLTRPHCRLQQRLLGNTREFPWCKVTICDEYYTIIIENAWKIWLPSMIHGGLGQKRHIIVRIHLVKPLWIDMPILLKHF